MPLFALANSGVHLAGMRLADLGGPVSLGIVSERWLAGAGRA